MKIHHISATRLTVIMENEREIASYDTIFKLLIIFLKSIMKRCI